MGKARERRLNWLAKKDLPNGEFYFVNDYGWGDGGCYGPMSALEALKKYNEAHFNYDDITKSPYTIKEQLKNAMSDQSRMHYITDYDVSDRFNDFMSS